MHFAVDSIKQKNKRRKKIILEVGAETRSHFVLWSPQSTWLIPLLDGYYLAFLVVSATCAWIQPQEDEWKYLVCSDFPPGNA